MVVVLQLLDTGISGILTFPQPWETFLHITLTVTLAAASLPEYPMDYNDRL